MKNRYVSDHQIINCNSDMPVTQCINCWAKMDKDASVCPNCGIRYIDFFNPNVTSEQLVVLRLRDPVTQRGVDVMLNPMNVCAYVRQCEGPDNIDLYPNSIDIHRFERPVISKRFELGFDVDATDTNFVMRYVDCGDSNE